MKTKIIILLLAALIFSAIIVNLSKRKSNNNMSIQFRASITKITKYYRGRYDLELKSIKEENILISDYDFGKYKDKIKTGDSIIKILGSNCFYYKNKLEVLSETCDGISEIEFFPR